MTVTTASAAADPAVGTVLNGVLQGVSALALTAIPGYALGVVSARGVRDPDASDQAFLARAALGSAVVHGTVLPWTIELVDRISRDGLGPQALQIWAWVGTVCVALPLLFGNIEAWLSARGARTAAGRLARVLGVAGSSRLANAWSEVFTGHADTGGFTRVVLRDGRALYGFFGEESFASADAKTHDLFLEKTVVVGSDGLGTTVADSRGVWINGSDIVSIEFFLSEQDSQATTRKGRRRMAQEPQKQISETPEPAEVPGPRPPEPPPAVEPDQPRYRAVHGTNRIPPVPTTKLGQPSTEVPKADPRPAPAKVATTKPGEKE